MISFADSSAVVKLYADEPGADVVRSIETLVVSQLCAVEVPAAIWRKQRMGELAVEDAHVLGTAFDVDYYGNEDAAPRFVVVAVHDDVVADAARLCAVHPLRAYDAVQLASALAVAALGANRLSFVAFDVQLRRAAAAEGLSLLG